MNKIIYSIFFVFLILSCGNDNPVNEKELELKEKELEIRERKLALENEMASKEVSSVITNSTQDRKEILDIFRADYDQQTEFKIEHFKINGNWAAVYVKPMNDNMELNDGVWGLFNKNAGKWKEVDWSLGIDLQDDFELIDLPSQYGRIAKLIVKKYPECSMEIFSQSSESSEDWAPGPSQYDINYKVEFIEVQSECQNCGKNKKDNYVKFPKLNLSEYGREEEIQKLWKEHKSIVENEILGGHPAAIIMTNILSPRDQCKSVSSKIHDWYSESKSTFLNKTFKINP